MKPNRVSTMPRGAFVRVGLIWMLACVSLGLFCLWKAAPEGKKSDAGERIAASTIVSRRTMKIQDLRVGDTVLSRDEADPNAPLGHREVTALSRNTAFRLQVIRFADGAGKIQEIRTTDKHPFWVIGKGWTDASQLSAGMSLAQPDGSRAQLVSNTVEEHSEGVAVFNLTVAEDHTYFVSASNSTGSPVWVHNVTCLSAVNANPQAGRTIGLGIEDDLINHRGTGALIYKNAAWQQAGLTSVDWGRAIIDRYWFEKSFREAASNASAIRFDVSSYSLTYPKPGITAFEFNHIINTPSLFQKTTFIQNGETVIWNGKGFVKP